MSGIVDWQRRFFSTQSVWVTFFREDGFEEISNIYESQEAAQLEVDWYRGKRGRPMIRQMHIHTAELAAERWRYPAAVAAVIEAVS